MPHLSCDRILDNLINNLFSADKQAKKSNQFDWFVFLHFAFRYQNIEISWAYISYIFSGFNGRL